MSLITTLTSLLSLHMLLITTFLLPLVGRVTFSGREKKWVCDSGIGITWVHVSRLPMLHPDRDRWKNTTITNYSSIFQYASLTRSHRYVPNLQHIIIKIIKKK